MSRAPDDTILAWALRYGEPGYRPIPLWWVSENGVCACPAGERCPSPGKHPIEKLWSETASSNPEEIRRKFEKWPLCNIGLAMGDGVVAVDKDNAYAADELESRGLTRETPTQRTGGGGEHAVFHYADSVTLANAVRFIAGADLRTDGGQIVVEPSVTDKGSYRWDPDRSLFEMRPAELPQWVADLCPKGGNGNKPPVKIEDLWVGVPAGTRNKTLFRYACKMRHDCRPEIEILAACLEFGRHCKPPLSGDEVNAIVASSGRYEDAGPRDFPPEDEDEQPATGLLADLWHPVEISCLTTPPRRRDWLLTLPDGLGGHGVLPRGKVGILASEGGVGKTKAQVELAVSLITGRRWFGYYQVPLAVTGKVLLLLAEEDMEDMHRGLWKIAEGLGLTNSERMLLAERLVAIPLMGIQVALTAVSGAGIAETPFVQALRNRLVREAGEEGWALIGVDPLSRFAGGDVEGSNEAATRYIGVLESLTTVPGHPTVLVSSHSSKIARRQGRADVRGVTGLSDAARWVATMRREGQDVHFEVVKSNYSLPCPPLRLRWHEEVLEAISGAEILDAAAVARAAQGAELDDDVRRVVEVLVHNGAMTSRDAIAHAAGFRMVRGRAAIDLAIARGIVIPSGTARRPRYVVANGGVCSSPPHTPGTAGTASQALRPTPSGLSGTGTGRAGTGGRAEGDR